MSKAIVREHGQEIWDNTDASDTERFIAPEAFDGFLTASFS